MEWQRIGGVKPVLVLLNKYDEVLEEIDITPLSREEINQLLLKKGFFKKGSKDGEVPDKYKEGPYVERDEL